VREGDIISLNVAKRRLDLELSDEEIQHRAGSVEGTRPALQDRRDGEIRADGVVGVNGSGDGITTTINAEHAEHAEQLRSILRVLRFLRLMS
jgi:dihydroxyacid dehydratase/phosphogluconate dehydratase